MGTSHYTVQSYRGDGQPNCGNPVSFETEREALDHAESMKEGAEGGFDTDLKDVCEIVVEAWPLSDDEPIEEVARYSIQVES